MSVLPCCELQPGAFRHGTTLPWPASRVCAIDPGSQIVAMKDPWPASRKDAVCRQYRGFVRVLRASLESAIWPAPRGFERARPGLHRWFQRGIPPRRFRRGQIMYRRKLRVDRIAGYSVATWSRSQSERRAFSLSERRRILFLIVVIRRFAFSRSRKSSPKKRRSCSWSGSGSG